MDLFGRRRVSVRRAGPLIGRVPQADTKKARHSLVVLTSCRWHGVTAERRVCPD